MKRIIICGNPTCGRLVRLSESYLAKVEDFSPLAAQKGTITLDGKPLQIKIRLCRQCTRKAGYKVGKRKVVIKK